MEDSSRQNPMGTSGEQDGVVEPAIDARLDSLKPVFAENVKLLLEKAHEAGLNVGLFEGRRSAERQKWLQDHGVNRQDASESWSSHQDGTGADILFKDSRGNWSRAPEHDWQKIGAIGESLGLMWGGRSTPPVQWHFQSQNPFSVEALAFSNRFDSGLGCGGACGSCHS